nr:hypothetical protein [Ktedonobacterales bacterium]
MSAHAPLTAPPAANAAADQAPSPPSRAPRRSRHWLTGALLPLAAIALEAFPLSAWLMVVAGSEGDIARTALPLWWLCGALLLAAGVGAAFRARAQRGVLGRVAVAVFGLVIIAGWAGSVLISVVLSPSAYGGQS